MLIDSATGEVVAPDTETLAAELRNLRERNGALQEALTSQNRKLAAAKAEQTRAAGSEPDAADIRAVLEHWRDTYHPKAKIPLDGERAKKVRARLGDGFTVDQLKQALDLAGADDWFVQHGHDDPKTVLRSEATKYLKVVAQGKPSEPVVRPLRAVKSEDPTVPVYRPEPLDRVVIALRDEFGADRVRGEWSPEKERMVGWISACPIRPYEEAFPMRIVPRGFRDFPGLGCHHGCTHEELAEAVRNLELRYDRRREESISRARAAA